MLKTSKKRNPFAVPAKSRKAGPHKTNKKHKKTKRIKKVTEEYQEE